MKDSSNNLSIQGQKTSWGFEIQNQLITSKSVEAVFI